MRFTFGKTSDERLKTADPELQIAFQFALLITPVDFGITCGYRDEMEQAIAFQEGNSDKEWPRSKHNTFPSLAVDFYPWKDGKAQWGDEKLFYLIAGLVLGVGAAKGYRMRWGGAWKGTLNKPGQLQDLGHIELIL